MNPRERFQQALIREYELPHFDAVVRSALKEKLENFIIATDFRLTVGGFLEALEREETKLKVFLIYLASEAPVDIRSVAREYYEDAFKIPIPVKNPYAELVIQNDPFVDRKDLREQLEFFFGSNNYQILSTRGPRSSGRSHCKIFVRHTAKAEGMESLVLDMLKSSVAKMITDISNYMDLDRSKLYDPLAQPAAQIEAFISAFRGMAIKQPVSDRKWCLIFDHHDRKEVDPDVRDFVEALVEEVAQGNLPDRIRIVLLGRGDWVKVEATLHHRITDVSTVNLNDQDIEKFLWDLSKENKLNLEEPEIKARKAKVLDGIDLKEYAGITAMSIRLRDYFKK